MPRKNVKGEKDDYDHLEDDGNPDRHIGDPLGENGQLHLDMHRAADELGKYAIEIEINSEEGIPKARMEKFIQELMNASAEECFARGADLIGHIKSFLMCGDSGSMMNSLVVIGMPIKKDDRLRIETIHKGIFVLHVIVHGIWDDVVHDATMAHLDDKFKKYGIEYMILDDYFDTEKSIQHHM